MASAPAAAPPAAPAKKKGKLVLIVAAVLAAAAGGALPMVVDVSKLVGAKPAEDGKDTDKKKKRKPGHDEHLAAVPVGDVSVNLAEERMTRFLRVKVAVQVDAAAEKKVHELVDKQKVALKSWMIGHIAGKSLKDVSGTLGVNRLQREMMERFDDMLYPNGDSPIRAVLFEEYIVQ